MGCSINAYSFILEDRLLCDLAVSLNGVDMVEKQGKRKPRIETNLDKHNEILKSTLIEKQTNELPHENYLSSVYNIRSKQTDSQDVVPWMPSSTFGIHGPACRVSVFHKSLKYKESI